MLRTTLAVLAVLALTACTDRGTSTVGPAKSTAPPGALLAGRTYEAVEVTEDGTRRPLVRGTALRVGFGPDDTGGTRGTIGVEAGCNRLTAPVAIGRTRLDVGEIGTTDKGCTDALLEQDRWLAAFFRADPSWHREQNDLVLEHGRTRIRLTEPPPVRPEAILGVEWTVYGLIDSGTETGTEPGYAPSLVFDGTHVTGDTPCARLQAPASVGAGTIELGVVRLSSVRPCPSGGDALHAAVTGVLGSGTTLTYTLENRTLRILSGDRGLLLRRR